MLPGVTNIKVKLLPNKRVIDNIVSEFSAIASKKREESQDTETKKDPPRKFTHLIPPCEAKIYRPPQIGDPRMYTLKEALKFLPDGFMKEMLYKFKTKIADDPYCEGADMRNWYHLHLEETVAIFAYTHGVDELCCCTEETPVAKAINNALSEGKGISTELTAYLLILLTALRKIPEYYASDILYIIQKSDNSELFKPGNEVVLPVFTLAYTDKQEAKSVMNTGKDKADLVLVEVKKAGKVFQGHTIYPLSSSPKSSVVLFEPGLRMTIKEVGSELVTAETSVANNLILTDEVSAFVAKTPLPEGWAMDKEDGKIFYINEETQQTQWDRPELEDPNFFTDLSAYRWKQLVDPEKGTFYENVETKGTQLSFPEYTQTVWEEKVDFKSKRPYYANHFTKITTWEKPPSYSPCFADSNGLASPTSALQPSP